MTTRNRFILGFAAGAAIGTAAALLAAPKTGKETRHIVTQGAGRFAASQVVAALNPNDDAGRAQNERASSRPPRAVPC